MSHLSSKIIFVWFLEDTIEQQPGEINALVKSETNEQKVRDKTIRFFNSCGIQVKEESNFIFIDKKKFR